MNFGDFKIMWWFDFFQDLVESNLKSNLKFLHESRAFAKEPRDAAAVVCGLKFADNIHYKFKSGKASKARLQS